MYEVLRDRVVSATKKKYSKSSTLSLRSGNYIIPTSEGFCYFKATMKEDQSEDSLFLKFEKTPLILIDGYMVFEKQAYRVTVRDLFKGRIRKSQKVTRKDILDAINGTADTSTGTTSTTEGSTSSAPEGTTEGVTTGSIQSSRQPRAGEAIEIEDEDAKEADVYLSEQARTLQGIEYSEEELL